MALAAAFCLLLGGPAAAAPKPAKPAGTKVTIDTWPQGVFGYVDSSAQQRCAAKRRVEVLERVGERRDPSRDRRVAVTRAGKGQGTNQWAVRTSRSGALYAHAAKRSGCAAATSGVLAARPLGDQGEKDDYPPCSPYVNEGLTYICKFEELHASLSFCSDFGVKEGVCSGDGVGGLFPWGTRAYRGEPDVTFHWNWNTNFVRLVSYRVDQGDIGTAFLSGTMPSAKSDRYSIKDAFAQNDRGIEQGPHFYTPDLPGQDPGQIGGPLHLNVVGGDAFSRTQLYISGYMYLRREEG